MPYPQLDPLDPDDKVKYSIDFSKWLESVGGDTISSVAWTVQNCTQVAVSNTSTVATITVNAGTANTIASVTAKITTSTGLIKSQTVQFKVLQQ